MRAARVHIDTDVALVGSRRFTGVDPHANQHWDAVGPSMSVNSNVTVPVARCAIDAHPDAFVEHGS